MKYGVLVKKVRYGYLEVEADCVEEAEYEANKLYLDNKTQWTKAGLDFFANPNMDSRGWMIDLAHEMNNFEYVIWSNESLEWEDWRDAFDEDCEQYSDDEKFQLMNNLNNDYLEDDRREMDVCVGSPIIIIADIGKWDGRHAGYRILESVNLRDCLYSELDGVTWYVDGKGDFRMDGYHHDGHNHYLYRKFKEGIGSDVRDEFCEKILDHTLTKEDIEAVTERLGDVLEELYGFILPENYEKKYMRRMER